MKLKISIEQNGSFKEISRMFLELHECRCERESGRCIWCIKFFDNCNCGLESKPKFPDIDAINEYNEEFPIQIDDILL